ncbi:MAG: cytidine deaminase [Ruminococcus sp.]|nr:cytidine deaminase [Ruminococcus sp.]
MYNSETIIAAYTVANQILESNPFVSPEDTVCSIRARSGRIFVGSSHMNIHAEIEAINSMQAAGEVIVDEFILIGVQSKVQFLPCNNCAGFIMSLHPENANCAVIMPDRAIRLADVGMFAANPAGPVNHPFPGAPPMNIAPPPVVPLTVPPQPVVVPKPVTVEKPAPAKTLAAVEEPDDAPVRIPEPFPDDVQEAEFDGAHESGVDLNTIEAESDERFNSNLLKSRVNSLLRVASDEDEEIDRLTEKKKRFGFFRK